MPSDPTPPDARGATAVRPLNRFALALLALLALGGVAALVASGALDAAWLASRRDELLALQAAAPLAFVIGFIGLFTLFAALALPGCSLLALAAGPCFGWVAGTLLVVLGATLGATVSFLAARHWAREAVQRRFGAWLHILDRHLARDGAGGAFALFMLRMAPVIPFPVLNPLLGLGTMPTGRFFVVSALGMLAGSAAYVHAGSAMLAAGGPALSASLVLALAVIGVLPWALAQWWRRRVRRAVA